MADTIIDVHPCPFCELRFANRTEAQAHVQDEHAAPLARADEPVVVPSDPHPFARVVVPLDPTSTDHPEITLARQLAERGDLSMELVAAIPTWLDARTTDAALRARADEVGGDVDVHCTDLGRAQVADATLAHLRAHPAQLVCLASRGATAVGEALFGSHSEAIVREAEAPVAVVGPHATVASTIDRLVVGFDGSEHAERAARAALAMASALDIDLHLVEVVDPAEVPTDVDEGVELRRLAKTLDGAATSWDTLHGADPARALADAVEPTDLLVVGTHGRTGWRRMQFGSVAMRTIRHAPVPVVVINGAAPLS